jgi:hypothetical protein
MDTNFGRSTGDADYPDGVAQVSSWGAVAAATWRWHPRHRGFFRMRGVCGYQIRLSATPKTNTRDATLPNHQPQKARNSRVASRVPASLPFNSCNFFNLLPYGVGRGCGVGRGLGVTLGVAVGVTEGVGVTVVVGVGVGVPGVGVGVGVGLTHGCIS